MGGKLSVDVPGGSLVGAVLRPNPEAPVLLLLADGPGGSSAVMAPFADLAGDDMGIATFDQRGAWGSVGVTDDFSLQSYVSDVEAVRAALGAERLIVMGHGWGALVALAWAADHGEAAEALILVEPSRATASEQLAFKAAFRREALNKGLTGPEASMECTQNNVRPGIALFYTQAGTPLRDVFARCDWTTAQATATALQDYDLTERMTLIDIPVWWIRGEAMPGGDVGLDGLRDALGNVLEDEVIVRRCGGMLWDDCPKPFFTLITSIVAEVRMSPSDGE